MAARAEREGATSNPISDPYPTRPTSSPAPRKAWSPTVDRTGQFRLATIQTGARATPPAPRKRAVRGVKVWRFDPIEVTPDDLRPAPPPTYPRLRAETVRPSQTHFPPPRRDYSGP
ncbi:hypothetical protein AB8615_01440 [Litorimonas sp. RW-G-Af-16]|uniref:hypothetical protein n=1 Tax=Litorimonas sp. RW-G-Af-16 TaxID=3241168 RepID=UPI003AAFE1EB